MRKDRVYWGREDCTGEDIIKKLISRLKILFFVPIRQSWAVLCEMAINPLTGYLFMIYRSKTPSTATKLSE